MNRSRVSALTAEGFICGENELTSTNSAWHKFNSLSEKVARAARC
jgi:hypothetical protein